MSAKWFMTPLFFLFFSGMSAKTLQSEIDTAKLSVALYQIAEKFKVPDFAVSIMVRDSLIFHLDKNKENRNKNYYIGSCSKSFTALAVLTLVKEGRIDLDKPVREYLPWFELKNKKWADSITVRHLLNHTSGLERQYGFFEYRTADMALFEKNLSAYIQTIPVRFSPGTTFQYSNLNYLLLGLIVSRTAHETYAAYVSQNIFPSIGMNGTFAAFSDEQRQELIQPYHYLFIGIPFKSKSYPHSDFAVPYGYISSNSSDLCNYLQFMLHGTISKEGDTLLAPDLYSDLTGSDHNGYGMGWFHSNADSVNVINHGGMTENFSSSLKIYPDIRFASVVLCNTNSMEFCAQVDQLIYSRLSGKPWHSPFSFEKLQRWLLLILPALLLLGFIFNFFRWRAFAYKIGLVAKIIPLLRLIIGIVLSLIVLILLPKMFGISLANLVKFGPDMGWGMILIGTIGLASSLIRHFGTKGKMSTIRT
jgi:CubicO group peptidase (beta-lactamase class C family)